MIPTVTGKRPLQIPSHALPGVTIDTNRGYFKGGCQVMAVLDDHRTVYVGEACHKTVIPEWTLYFREARTTKDFDGKWAFSWHKGGCQEGRDFVFDDAAKTDV